MTQDQFLDVIKDAGVKAFHYFSSKDVGYEHIVWQEIAPTAYAGDNRRKIKVMEVQVDLYTKEENTPALKRLEDALDEAEIPYSGPYTTFDRDDGFIRHMLECEVVGWE